MTRRRSSAAGGRRCPHASCCLKQGRRVSARCNSDARPRQICFSNRRSGCRGHSKRSAKVTCSAAFRPAAPPVMAAHWASFAIRISKGRFGLAASELAAAFYSCPFFAGCRDFFRRSGNFRVCLIPPRERTITNSSEGVPIGIQVSREIRKIPRSKPFKIGLVVPGAVGFGRRCIPQGTRFDTMKLSTKRFHPSDAQATHLGLNQAYPAGHAPESF